MKPVVSCLLWLQREFPKSGSMVGLMDRKSQFQFVQCVGLSVDSCKSLSCALCLVLSCIAKMLNFAWLARAENGKY